MKKLLFFIFLVNSLLYGGMWGDSKPKIQFNADVYENSESKGYITLEVNLTKADSDNDTTFHIKTSDDSANSDDYTAVDKNFTIPAGKLGKEFNITVNNDDLYENDENITVKITEHSDNVDDGDSLNTKAQIDNDDDKPVVSWKSADRDVKEKNDDFNTTMTLQLDKKSGLDTTITIDTKDGLATKDEDYNTTKTSITIPAGATKADVNFTIIGDTDSESTEDFNVTIKDADNADIDTDNDKRTINIKDDDSVDEVYVKNIAVSESDGTISVTIAVKDGAKKDIDVDWETDDDTAVKDDDYKHRSGTLHFDKGDTEKTISIDIVDDDIGEDEEKFKIVLSTSTEDTETIDGYVIIKESDRLIITGEDTDSPESLENKSPMKIFARLKDPNEKAKNDIKIDIKTSDNTATDGDDYTGVDSTYTISSGDNGVEIDVDILDDDTEESNEIFDVNMSCVDCGNVEINESTDEASIIDNDRAPSLTTMEYNDTDNYYLRDGSDEKHYKRLFCTPINIWGPGDDDDNKVQIASPDDNITQIFQLGDRNVSYGALYAKNIEITSDGKDGKVCDQGTAKCKTQNLFRLGDEMDVNTSWFYKDKIGDYVEKKVPKCESGKSIDIYNVDEDGRQIWWAKGDEWADCTINFKIRDKNYSKPFLIEYVKTYDNDRSGDNLDKHTTFNAAPGIYFWKKVKYDGKIFLNVKNDDYPDAPYKIARMYFGESEHGGDNGYVFAQYSHINYDDCNGDGKVDKGDVACQNPSRFMYWFGGLEDDSMIIAIEKEEYFAGYFYDAVGKRDTRDPVNVKFAKDVEGAFVGGISAWWIRLDPESNQLIYWVKPDPDMRLFLGDSDKCIYTPNIYLKGEDKVFKESEGGEANINISVEYFTSFSRKSFCERDNNISFDYVISQRYTDNKDKDGNATQDVDYSANDYSKSITLKRACSNCDRESCLLPLTYIIDDFDVKADKTSETDELFDFNLSNVENGFFEDNNTLQHYLMTIIDVPAPKTLIGAYDVYDPERSDKNNNNDGTYGNDDNEDRNITTKIVGKEFTLTFGSFDLADETDLKVHTDDDGNDIELKYGILKCPDMNTTDVSDCIKITQSDKEVFDEEEEERDFTINKLVRYAAAYVTVCSKEKDDGNLTLYTYDDCDGNTKCKDDDGNNQKCLRDVMSTDKFSIRPKEFKVENVPDKVVAGEEFNITIKALDNDGNEIDDYNQTITLSNKDVTIVYNEDKSGCNKGDLSFDDKNFTNGEANLTMSYNEIGKLNFEIKEYNSTEAFASVDSGEDDDNLYIDSVSFSIKFIPDHFNIDASIKDYRDNYTFISSNKEVNATLDLNVSVVGSDDTITKNYTESCYGNNVIVDINHTKIEDKTLGKLFYIIGSDKTNIGKNDDITFNVKKDQFNNGKFEKVLYINFDKNYSTPTNPFDLKIDTIKVDEDGGDNISGLKKIDKSAHMVYVRLQYPKSFTTYSDDINQTFRYQKYNNGWETYEEKDGNISSVLTENIDFEIYSIDGDKQIIEFGYGLDEKRPYKEVIHIDVSPWFWYLPGSKQYKSPSSSNKDCFTHPCVNLLFYKKAKRIWSGTGTDEKENNVTNNALNLHIQKHDGPNRDRSFIRIGW